MLFEFSLEQIYGAEKVFCPILIVCQYSFLTNDMHAQELTLQRETRGDHFFWVVVGAKCALDSAWNVTILITFLTFNIDSFIQSLIHFSYHFFLVGVMENLDHISRGQNTFQAIFFFFCFHLIHSSKKRTHPTNQCPICYLSFSSFVKWIQYSIKHIVNFMQWNIQYICVFCS